MVTESFRRGWEIFKDDMGSWLVFGLVWTLLASLAGTVVPIVGGLLTLPMALREASKAVRENRSPDLNGLFEFKSLGEDFVSTLLYSIAQFVGVLCCCIGWPFAWILFWYTPELAADGRVSPTDAMKVSLAWSKENLGDTIAMALLGLFLNSLGASVGVGIGVFFTAPITLLAWVMYWQAVKSDVYATARAQGIEVRGETAALGVEQSFDGVADRDRAEERHHPPTSS